MNDEERAELERLRQCIKDISSGRKAKSSYDLLVMVAKEAGFSCGKNESKEAMLVRIVRSAARQDIPSERLMATD